MSLNIPAEVLTETRHASLEGARKLLSSGRLDYGVYHVPTSEVTDALLSDLANAAIEAGSEPYGKAIAAISAARRGKFRSIPNPHATSEVLLAYLNQDAIDGWVYVSTALGHPQPCLVLDIVMRPTGSLEFKVTYSSPQGHSRMPDMWASRELRILTDGSRGIRTGRPETILRRFGLHKETPTLKQQYLEHLNALHTLFDLGVGTRCTANGIQARPRTMDDAQTTTVTGHTVIFDTTAPAEPALTAEDPRLSAPARVPADPDMARIPVVTVLEVFDPTANTAVVMHAAAVTAYVYDDTLIDKLVLPRTHSRLLSVLTADTSSHLADVIGGKTAGNLILCKGRPGVGKTLTAEVYAEVLHKALYSIDLAVLLEGDKFPGPVRYNLQTVFDRVRRWDAVLLVDEADVLVGARGNDLARNALTAEFLRVFEYFERLTFLTTNRPDDIDDAILSRCAAIIAYEPPTGDDAARAWRTLAGLHQLPLSPRLVDQLVATFPQAAPRDMRQLLRLVVQIAEHEDREVTLGLFTECAVFRGLTIREGSEFEPPRIEYVAAS